MPGRKLKPGYGLVKLVTATKVMLPKVTDLHVFASLVELRLSDPCDTIVKGGHDSIGADIGNSDKDTAAIGDI